MKPKSDTTKQLPEDHFLSEPTPPDSKEGLHTQGEGFNYIQLAKKYGCSVNDLKRTIIQMGQIKVSSNIKGDEYACKILDADNRFIAETVLNPYYEHEQSEIIAKLFCDVFNERKALLDALKACYNCLTMDSDMEEDFAPEIKQVKKLLDKAGW